MSVYCEHGIQDRDSEHMKINYEYENLKIKCEATGTEHEEGLDHRNITCKTPQEPTAELTSNKCAYTGLIVKVFYQVGPKQLGVYESCHDVLSRANYWTHYELSPANAAYQQSVHNQTVFRASKIYGDLDVNALYANEKVKETFRTVMKAATDRLINERHHLTFGQLMATEDGAVMSHQKAAALHVNVVPHFNCVHQCNWFHVEAAVRELAAVLDTELEVFSGTLDVMDYKGTLLYLRNEHSQLQFPVPKLLYKLILNAKTRKGMVVVGVNDVKARKKTIKNFVYCHDASDDTGLFGKGFGIDKRHRIKRGYIYICNIRDFLLGGHVRSWAEFRKYMSYDLLKLDSSQQRSMQSFWAAAKEDRCKCH